MKKLSDRARQLAGQLYKKPSVYRRFLGDSGWNVSALAELVSCNEPASIPYVAPILISGTREEIRAASAAIETLLSCSTPEDLIILDELVRSSWVFGCPYSESWSRLEPRELAKLVGPGEPGVSLFRLLSFHTNGFVREEAIRRLNLIYDGSELPYLLIRLNDWVPSIRRLSQDAVLARVQANYIDHFIKNLPLVFRLENTQRADHSQMLNTITQLLLTPRARPVLVAGLNDTSRVVRRACFRILTDNNPDDLQDLLFAALQVEDPIIRLWSVRKIPTVLHEDQLSEVLSLLSHDCYAPVRLETLRAWVGCFPTQSDENLRSALLDQNASVRDEARFHLHRLGDFDFVQFYRDAITVAQSKKLVVAISGLGETGGQSDADLLEPFLSHRVAKVRQTAIKYLIRLGGEQYLTTVLAKIVDIAPSVSAQVRREVKAYVATIGTKCLWDYFEKSSTVHVRKNILCLISALPKWESISCLIQLVDCADNAIALAAQEYIHRWNTRYNRSQSAPTRDQLMRLEAALSEHGSSLDEATFNTLSFAIKSLVVNK